ncbi:MAG: tetratricopeptide repeat protein, partial [Pirellulales bacterium]
MKRTLSQCGVGILVTLSMLFVLGAPGRAQVAPVKTLGECKTLEHASRQPSGEDESYEIPADDLLPLLLAHASFEKKDHAAALKGFQTFLRKHGAVTQRNVEVIKALNAMATSCLFLEEYTSAIDALNRLDMWVDDFSIPYRKGRCYARLEQHAAAVDEWRRAVAMAPDNPVPRVELAMLLVETPDLSLRNGDEALALLNGFESQIEEFPSIAMALAAAASATGDFDYAIKMQQRAIALSTDSEGKEYSQFLLGCYQEHWMPFPLFYRGLSPIEAEQRRVVLEQGTVLVRVRGRISHHWTKQGFCEHEIVERDHAGTVIDARGLFLVSGATIGINPSVDNGIDANRQSTWINGPIIEVFSIGQPDPLRLGEAEIVGYDAPTNVGVIRIKNSSPIDPIPGLREIPFQPGHLVELADKNDPCYSIEINGGRTPQLDPDDALLISALTKERPVSPLSYSVSPVAIDQDT